MRNWIYRGMTGEVKMKKFIVTLIFLNLQSCPILKKLFSCISNQHFLRRKARWILVEQHEEIYNRHREEFERLIEERELDTELTTIRTKITELKSDV